MGLLPDSYPRGPKYNFCLALEPHPVKLNFRKIEHLYFQTTHRDRVLYFHVLFSSYMRDQCQQLEAAPLKYDLI